ncbi:MAG TPA: prepilin-type N-terminal cleavage/methylation domain-containing protein [Gemmatimonadales bacterium]|nr:prepilin-type N-terminal cleavage/methylation domain-containing protein [Gemmatimonadales bacterium]
MDRKGFTLIELLIVVVIIGVLAAIALPKFANTKEKAAVGTMKADLRNLASVQEAYFMDSSRYANAIATLQAAPYTYRYSGQNTVTITAGTGNSWSATATNPAAGAITCSVSYNTGATDDGAPVCN